MNKLLKWTLCVAGILFVVYIMSFFFIDRPVDTWMHSFQGTVIFTAGKTLSFLASSTVLITVLPFCFVLIIFHDSLYGKKNWSAAIFYICVSVALAEIIGDCLKFLLGRYRPILYFEKGLYGFHFLGSEWSLRSTPSGHTLRAFSAMTALSVLYKRFTPLFLGAAVLIGASRVIVTDHYPSDVLFGAYVGIFTALWTGYFLSKFPREGKHSF